MSTQPPKRPRSSFSRRLKEARLGDVAAQYEVAVWYANGTGVARDATQAFAWMKSAAERNHPVAQYLLGVAYATGAGTDRDPLAAIACWKRAAEQGNDKACLRLGRFFEQAHPDIAYEWHLKAATLGSAAGQLAVAMHHAQGLGAPLDANQALAWCRKSAVQGHVPAQFALGRLIEQGQGAPADVQQACAWYREAAVAGHPGARVALGRLNADAPSTEPTRFEKYAEHGDPQDQFDLGELYSRGLLGPADANAAGIWYRRAASQGHTDAQVAVLGLEAFQSSSRNDALLLQAAGRGHAQAQFLIGMRLVSGESPVSDADGQADAHSGGIAPPLQALGWLARAAAQDHPGAWTALAQLVLEQGEGLGRAALAAAAQLGDAQAQYLIGHSLNNPGVAAAWYARAAEQDHAQALNALADLALQGHGMPRDPAVARDLWLRAAALGDTQAQWRLAGLYLQGEEGVRPNARSASTWLKRAARAGHAGAQARLAAIFAKGRRHDKAVTWWELAAAQDDPESLFNLANACRQARGTAQDPERGFSLMLRAAEKGLVPAQGQLGLMYATGEGVAADLIEAARWFELAAQGNDEGAQANLTRARELLNPAQQREASRRARAFGHPAKS